MHRPAPQTFDIRHPSDVVVARRAAKAAAASLGFEPKPSEEIALAMTELATNLLKHAREGRLTLRSLAAEGRTGLEIESLDQGPGIADVEQAMTDRFSTIGSRGAGLGAVNRLMDEFDIASRLGGSTRIVSRKWLPPRGEVPHRSPLAFGVATRPHPGFKQNGDAFVLCQWEESALTGIIDGLGHGQHACQAACTARQYVESHFDQPLDQIFAGVARVSRSTRGVVMALARFDWGRRTVAFASIGDVEVRIFPHSARFPFHVQRGILGLNAPPATVSEHPWDLDHTMVLHSDGVRTHWRWDDFPGLAARSAEEIARQLLQTLAREQDDATVVVARRTTP
jgi:anti-sigma regulatory factor (Ser/Thr protein kinase)